MNFKEALIAHIAELEAQLAAPPQGVPDEFGTAEHWKEKAHYWASEAHRLRGEALRGESVDGITHPTKQGLDAGNTDADRLIGRLLSSDPDFEDCTAAANLIRELTQNGPDGFATWKDAAVAERVLRVGMQHAIRSLSRVTYGYKSDGEGRYLTSYESSEGQFLRHADVMAALAVQVKQ